MKRHAAEEMCKSKGQFGKSASVLVPQRFGLSHDGWLDWIRTDSSQQSAPIGQHFDPHTIMKEPPHIGDQVIKRQSVAKASLPI
jgi:hypothetical protein